METEKWFIIRGKCDVKKLAQECEIPQYMAKILSNRNLLDRESIDRFLHPNLNRMHHPDLMKGTALAAELIIDALEAGDRIRIVGDYDVDGVMSAYVLLKGLSDLGAQVDYWIPDRIENGYGINSEMIEKSAEEGIGLVITCDNGIAAFDAAETAAELGIVYIVTDHHEVPKDSEGNELLVQADAIVDPKQQACTYPFKNLCGAGVAFKLLEKVYDHLNKLNEAFYELLEFVGFATICDIVELVDENRIIVKYGMKLINETKNEGLKALIKESRLNGRILTSHDIGFNMGPCINAAGRMGSAETAMKLLLADAAHAEQFAKELIELNISRKKETELGYQKIRSKILADGLDQDKVIVVYEPDVHESVVGIVAGRLKDYFCKPVIVLTNGLEMAKGSGRSIPEYDMFSEISKHRELLERFGGHAMAAGLSLEAKNIPSLRSALNENVLLTSENFIKKVMIDMHLPLEWVDYDLINNIEKMMPFGFGNEKPEFAENDLIPREVRLVGAQKNVLKMVFNRKKGEAIEALLFREVESFKNAMNLKYGAEAFERFIDGNPEHWSIDIVYHPSVNDFRGSKSLQVIISNFRI